jgi:endonuclease/exonuclease/phosphatase (EEP) superfamily protein YafD
MAGHRLQCHNSLMKNSHYRIKALTIVAITAAVLPLSMPEASSRSLLDKARACADNLGQLPIAEGQVLSPPLDILSWNIEKTSNDGWMEDLLEHGSGTHLTFIQEATIGAQLGEVHPTGPLYQSFAQGYSNSSQSTGVMTLSSHAPTMQCNFTRTEPWLGTPKAATVTEHALAGRDERLLAINLHAVNFTFGVEDLREQLRPLATLLANHRGPAILAGDFNTWSASRQQLIDQLLSGHGLNPVSFEPDLRTTAFGRALDHIYLRGLEAEYAEVIPVTSSDHNALRARLQLTM